MERQIGSDLFVSFGRTGSFSVARLDKFDFHSLSALFLYHVACQTGPLSLTLRIHETYLEPPSPELVTKGTQQFQIEISTGAR